MTLEKGIVYTGTLVSFDNQPTRYQDKFCRTVTIKLKNGNSIQAIEITTTMESQWAGMQWEEIQFVCLSPGSGNKLPWIKKDDTVASAPPSPKPQDQPLNAGNSENKSNVWLAERSASIAAQLLSSGHIKVEVKPGESFTDHFGSLTKSIAHLILKVAREL